MPSLDIHIVIAREYLKKYNDIKDEYDFIKGNIAPDLLDDRIASHYTKSDYSKDLISILNNKIGLDEYLQNKNIDNDYEGGYFLHLVTDYIFFNNFFDIDYIKKNDYSIFKKDLYYSYNIIHNYLKENYDINYGKFKDEVEKRILTSQQDANYNGEKRTNIIPYTKLDSFISKILKKDIKGYILLHDAINIGVVRDADIKEDEKRHYLIKK